MKKKREICFKSGVAFLLFFCCFQALAQPVPLNTRYRGMPTEEDDKPKKEWEVVLPAFPQEENLLPFYVSPIQTQKFAIDEKSLAVGEGEVRYTLVGISSSGVKNVTYEGVKCDGGLYRRYAIGGHDGTWSLSRYGEWRQIHFQDANRPQAALLQNYFCQGASIAIRPDEMIRRIRYNRSLLEEQYGSN